MNKIIESRPPTFANAGRVIMNVWNITFRFPDVLKSLRSLTILNVRSILVAVPTYVITLEASKIHPSNDRITIMKSKTL